MASWLLLITCFLAQIVGRVEVAEAMRCEIHLGDAHARLPTMHRALTTIERPHQQRQRKIAAIHGNQRLYAIGIRSEEHTSEHQSLMRISYSVLRLKK